MARHLTAGAGELPLAPGRPRRSVLYLPGSNARALEKARTLPTDGLILDCEDAVAPELKPLAREQICDVLQRHRRAVDGVEPAAGYGRREVVVRVNGLATPWGREDVQRVAAAGGADAVLIPKAERVEDVAAVAAILAECSTARPPPPVWAMIETPLGVLSAAALAALPQVECLVAGTSDLAADLRCDARWEDRAALVPALCQIVLAARAHGKAALDGVHLDLKDLDGLARHCAQGRALGFDGKTLIHPSTLETANRAFAPSADQVEHARRVIAAFGEAAAAGGALVVLDGRLIEELHVRQSRRVLDLHEAIAALEQDVRS